MSLYARVHTHRYRQVFLSGVPRREGLGLQKRWEKGAEPHGALSFHLTRRPRRSFCRRLRIWASSEKWCSMPTGRGRTWALEAM